jgi:hypothetical protein
MGELEFQLGDSLCVRLILVHVNLIHR